MKNSLNISVLRGPQFYKFSDCFLDTVERRLFKNNERIEITPKAYEVLQLLVENAGELISKDDLLGRIWGDNFVEEGNLTVQISKLRSSLDASKEDPYIVNEPGSGYRFVSQVHVVDDEEWAHLIENELAQRVDGRQKFSSIAIMPLQNESADDDIEYLADGITENLINSLSNANDLRVIARNTVFQFKDTDLDLKKLGRKLRVETILTGRIRLVRDNLVIGVELTKVADGTQIWGTQINEDFNDIFEVQDTISAEITSKLVSEMNDSHKNSDSIHSPDPDAYRYYSKGLYFFRLGGVENLGKAMSQLQEGMSLEPTNPSFHLALATCQFWWHAYDLCSLKETKKRMNEFIRSAELLKGSQSEIYYLKGVVNANFEWDFLKAQDLFQKSLSLKPDSQRCTAAYSTLLANLGRISEALSNAERLLRLDPLSVSNLRSVAKILYKNSQYDAALILLHETLEFSPRNYESLLLAAANLTELRRYHEAHDYLNQAEEILQHSEPQSMRAYLFAKEGEKSDALELLKTLEIASSSDPLIPPAYLGIVYSELEDYRQAFRSIEKSIECRNSEVLSIMVDPRFQKLRGQTEFANYTKKIGLV